MKKEKLNYTWSQFDVDCDSLVKQIRKTRFRPNTIISLARGGLCLGVKISHKLHKPLMIVSAKTYSDTKETMSTAVLNTSYTQPLISPALILDEISDSGRTLKIVMDHFITSGIDVKVATLIYKRHSKIKPDFYISEVDNNCWINFPWET